MAEATTEPRDLSTDLTSVGSRVSWSAIIAGAAIAVSCYVVLTLFLAALGVTLTESGVRANSVGFGVLIAMIVNMVVSLFLGGWVASQLTAGEQRHEAALYGLLTWAVVTAGFLILVGAGVRAGYFAVVSGAMIAQNAEQAPSWEEAARQAGVPEQQIASAKAAVDPQRVRAELNDPATREQAAEATVAASWTALVATMLAMAAAVGGAIAGRGTSFRLFPVMTGRREDTPRLIVPTA